MSTDITQDPKTRNFLALIERSEFAVKRHEKKSKQQLKQADQLIKEAQKRFK